MPHDLPPPARLPLLVLAMLGLLAGVLAGLARLGVPVPDLAAAQAGTHAALMVCGFFGTVISLERAVALGRLWAYLGPACAGLGAMALLIGAPTASAQGLFVAAAGILTIGSFAVVRRQRALFTVTLAIAALCWLSGSGIWLASADLRLAVPFWLAFLILTIAGERLELTRLLPTRPAAAPSFIAAVALILAGASIAPWFADSGLRVFAGGLLALSLWLLSFDIARHNARQSGLPRFIALCLLSGYGWLAAAALAGLGGGFVPGAALHDTAIHAIALGFVFAMVFGHAPIIFPAVAKVKIAYHPAFYLPLALLHLSLAARVAGDIGTVFLLRQAGAIANALALLAFVITLASRVALARGQPTPRQRRRR